MTDETPYRQLIAGNWKMNGLRDSAGEAILLQAALAARSPAAPGPDVAVCPPATLIMVMAELLCGGRIALGGQDCSAANAGAYTGDISAPMLKDAGASCVILGHSERRAGHGESDTAVAAKVTAAQAAGLQAIVCTGETAGQRAAGLTLDVVSRQIAGSLPHGVTPGLLSIAYEPIWAIGTGLTASNDDIAEVHAAIRARLVERLGMPGSGVRILYGGSVKPDNAAAILRLPEVGGALVGGASLKAADFLAIIGAAPV